MLKLLILLVYFQEVVFVYSNPKQQYSENAIMLDFLCLFLEQKQMTSTIRGKLFKAYNATNL
jgi:hypothetical protein